MTCKNRLRYDYNVLGGTLNLVQSNQQFSCHNRELLAVRVNYMCVLQKLSTGNTLTLSGS